MNVEDQLAAALRNDSTQLRTGFMSTGGRVKLGGVSVPAVPIREVHAVEGEKVLVAVTRKGDAPSQVFIIGTPGGPGPVEGTVLAAPSGSETITIDAGGETAKARFLASYTTPAAGDRVALMWQGGVCTVMGKAGAVPATESPELAPDRPPPPPSSATTGTLDVVCSDSGTIWPTGGWGSWAGGGSKVHQGTWGGDTVYGAWFYNGKTKQLAGKTIEKVRFRLPDRLRIGAYADATVHLYYHTADSRPSGDVNRTVGPHNVTIPINWSSDPITLPTGFGDALKNGGGIAIAGEPYMGFEGKQQSADSGQLLIDWEA